MNDVFEITEDHQKLLKNLWFSYDDWTEFGAPVVDPKRPYGNSDVYTDIAEILDIEPEGEPDSYGDRSFSVEQEKYMLKVHKEMEHVLQIFCRSVLIEQGRYEGKYGMWNKVS